MTETPRPQNGPRFLLTVAALIVIVAGLQAAETVIVPFLVSVFLAMLGIPPLGWLRARGVPTPLALILVLLGFVVIIVGLGLIVASSASEFTETLPQYQERIESQLDAVETRLADSQLLRTFGISVPEFPDLVIVPEEAAPDGIAEVDGVPEDVPDIDPGRTLPFGQILPFVGTIFSGVTNFLSYFVIVFLLMVFILTEAYGFPAKARAAFGESGGRLFQFRTVMHQVHRYLLIKTVVSLATGLTLGLWVWILGVDFPVLWGLLAFLLNYIPNIGSILAAVPPLVVAAIQPGGGVTLLLLVGVGYAVVNLVVGNFVEPSLMGHRLGLSTLVVFVSLMFWGWVWGGIGMLLSVPLTMVVKIFLEDTDEYRWIAVLLDKSPGPAK